MTDIYADARRYDALIDQHFAGGDLAYWKLQAALAGGPILELACGTGRLTIPISESGQEIAGLDSSEAMLALAREKSMALSLPIQWHLANMAAFDLGHRFSLIFLPNNSIAHLLTWKDFDHCLRCVRQNLAEGGRFMLDYFNPSPALLSRDPGKRFPVGSFETPDGAGQMSVSEQVTYDTALQINHIRWFWHLEATGEETISDFMMRVYFPQELDALLELNGFAVEAKYGDYNLSPFTSTSRHQLIVARQASELLER